MVSISRVWEALCNVLVKSHDPPPRLLHWAFVRVWAAIASLALGKGAGGDAVPVLGTGGDSVDALDAPELVDGGVPPPPPPGMHALSVRATRTAATVRFTRPPPGRGRHKDVTAPSLSRRKAKSHHRTH